MEGPSWIANAAAWLSTVALLLLAKHLRRRKLNPPPGPKPWPIIRNLNLTGSLPHRSILDLLKYGPIMQLQFRSFPVVVGSSVEMAKIFLKTMDISFVGRPKTAAGKCTTYNYSDFTRSQNSKIMGNRRCRSFLLLTTGQNSAQLSASFYSRTCTQALSLIKTIVSNVVRSEARMGASPLRLHFHDCFVNGCDVSILLDDTPNFKGEQTALANDNSIRGLDVIYNIKTQLQKSCVGVVSCADIFAVAARDLIVALGDPSWNVLLGRRNSTITNLSAVKNNLPAPAVNLSRLIFSFSKKGFNAKEMVALSGSHTIGQARCITFRDRIYKEKNINASFAASL